MDTNDSLTAAALHLHRLREMLGLHQLLRAQAKAWWLWGQFDESFAKGAAAVNAITAQLTAQPAAQPMGQPAAEPVEGPAMV